jgi:hypothetical protein
MSRRSPTLSSSGFDGRTATTAFTRHSASGASAGSGVEQAQNTVMANNDRINESYTEPLTGSSKTLG